MFLKINFNKTFILQDATTTPEPTTPEPTTPEPTTPEPTTPEPTTPEVTTPKEIIKEKIISAVIPEFEYSDLQKLYEPEDPLVLAEYVEKVTFFFIIQIK